jgi:replicative DNA helicase
MWLQQRSFDRSISLQEKLSEADEKLRAIALPDDESIASLETAVTNRIAELQDVVEGNISPGYPTGFYDLDAVLNGGYKPGKLYVVGGRPGMGKTGKMLADARNLAERGYPCLIFSVEMSKEEIAERLLCCDTAIPNQRLAMAKVTPQDWETIFGSLSRLGELPIWIDDNPAITPQEIEARIRQFTAVHSNAVVFVDYLQRVISGENQRTEIDDFCRRLKTIARQKKLPVVLMSQLNRSVESQADKRPKMKDLKESGGIEQEADAIIFLYRPEYYDPETPERGVVYLYVEKNRGGQSPATIKLLYEPSINRFKNIRGAA